MHLPEGELAIPTDEPGRLTNALILILLGLLLLGGTCWASVVVYGILGETTTQQFSRPTAEENNEPESTNAEAETNMEWWYFRRDWTNRS